MRGPSVLRNSRSACPPDRRGACRYGRARGQNPNRGRVASSSRSCSDACQNRQRRAMQLDEHTHSLRCAFAFDRIQRSMSSIDAPRAHGWGRRGGRPIGATDGPGRSSTMRSVYVMRTLARVPSPSLLPSLRSYRCCRRAVAWPDGSRGRCSALLQTNDRIAAPRAPLAWLAVSSYRSIERRLAHPAPPHTNAQAPTDVSRPPAHRSCLDPLPRMEPAQPPESSSTAAAAATAADPPQGGVSAADAPMGPESGGLWIEELETQRDVAMGMASQVGGICRAGW